MLKKIEPITCTLLTTRTPPMPRLRLTALLMQMVKRYVSGTTLFPVLFLPIHRILASAGGVYTLADGRELKARKVLDPHVGSNHSQ